MLHLVLIYTNNMMKKKEAKIPQPIK